MTQLSESNKNFVNADASNVAWNKYADGLVPAVVQNILTGEVLMLGFMNQESIAFTEKEKKVTFYSRSKKTLWTKGETSGHYLHWVRTLIDCDQDTFLIFAIPEGPTCHEGTDTCFGTKGFPVLKAVEQKIQERLTEKPEGSYVVKLFEEGIDRMIQKVGEEAIETVIAAKNAEAAPLISESADLLFHLLMLFKAKNIALADVMSELHRRFK